MWGWAPAPAIMPRAFTRDAEAQTAGRTSTRIALPPWPACFLVASAAVVPFLSTLNTYFTGDDFGLIQLFSSKPPLHFLTLFTTSWTEMTYGRVLDELRPLVALSYQVDSLWGAATPAGYHTSNIAVHAANALLVLVLARGICGLTSFGATIAGALFAVLPVHAAAVAWISGRADSIPSLFYLSAFLLFAMWRRQGSTQLYVGSLALSVFALFSKQSAITFVVSIAMFDLLVERRAPKWSWSFARPYVPYVAATLLYLGLRYVLFGNAVREQSVTDWTFLSFGLLQVVNVGQLILGWHSGNVGLETFVGADAGALTLLGGGFILWSLVVLLAEGRKVLRRAPESRSRYVWYFGPAWWLIGSAPLAVTYVSPMHLYLVAVGVAIVVGLALDVLWVSRRRALQFLSAAGATVLIVMYGTLQRIEVDGLNSSGGVSAQAVRDVEREAFAAPPGSLLILDAPGQWTWGMPYVVRPPFMDPTATRDVYVMSNREVYCCSTEAWAVETREVVARWADQTHPGQVILMRWDAAGNLMRVPTADQTGTRVRAYDLLATQSSTELRQRLKVLLTPGSREAND